MKSQEHDELTPIFEGVAVELPPALSARLQVIPLLPPPISLGRIAAVLTGGLLVLAVAWSYGDLGLNLWVRGTNLLIRPVNSSWDFLVELAYRTSLPQPELAVIYGLMVAVVVLINLGLGLYLRAESRGLRLYAHQLTGQQ